MIISLQYTPLAGFEPSGEPINEGHLGLHTYMLMWLYFYDTLTQHSWKEGNGYVKFRLFMLCDRISASQHHRLIMFKLKCSPLFEKLQDN